MRIQSDIIQRIEPFVKKHKTYKLQAYLFILGALDFTLKKLNRNPKDPASKRHVTGQEFSHGIKEYAISQFGPTSKMVFEHWGIKSTMDFGHIVYNLIKMGLMGKSKEDKLSDFKNVFDFEEEFVKKYRFKLNK
jgi:uncharacterized repeat protein (TIGR04138 family)